MTTHYALRAAVDNLELLLAAAHTMPTGDMMYERRISVPAGREHNVRGYRLLIFAIEWRLIKQGHGALYFLDPEIAATAPFTEILMPMLKDGLYEYLVATASCDGVAELPTERPLRSCCLMSSAPT